MTGLVPVAAEPTSLVAVTNQCAAAEAWAEQCTSVPELQDVAHKFGGIDEYLARTSKEGRGRVAATIRRLEERIGHLLGPTKAGERHDLEPLVATKGSGLTPIQRHEFRVMAAHPEIVEEVIAGSTDTEPASRRKVTDAIRAKVNAPEKRRRRPLVDQVQTAGWELRKAVERLERIESDDRYSSHKSQVADHLIGHLSHAIEVCQDLLDGLTNGPQEDR